jgi:uncharacterized protein
MVEFNPGNTSPYAFNASSQSIGGRGFDPSISRETPPTGNRSSGISSLNIFNKDLELDNISDLTPQQLRQMGVKGVIFDLDDTLMPMGSGEFPPDAIETLKRLQQSGIKVGIISNNPSDEYTGNAKAKLAEQGLNIPFIKSATKPAPDDFLAMANHMGLPPEEIAMVGDSRISDMIGGNLAGMKTIHAKWYNADGWQKARGVLGDIGSSIMSGFRELFGSDKPPEFVDPQPA